MIRAGVAALQLPGVTLELTRNHNRPALLDRPRTDGVGLLDGPPRSRRDRLVDLERYFAQGARFFVLERKLVAEAVDVPQDGRRRRRSAAFPFVERANGVADAARCVYGHRPPR